MKRSALVAVLCLSLFASGALVLARQGEPPLEITYIANEGFLVAFGEHKFLIDALFREGISPYAAVPPAWREKLETAQSPFDGVDLILVSHHHADHFHPQAVGRHLAHNPGAVLVSSPQVVERLAREYGDFAAIEGRVKPLNLKGDERISLTVGGIAVSVHRATHGSGRVAEIQNLGHIITIGGRKLLHVGDTVAKKDDLKDFGWAEEEIDIAFLPYWYLVYDDWKDLVEPYIRAEHVVAMHIPPGELDKWRREIRAAFSNATIFTRQMETKAFSSRSGSGCALLQTSFRVD